MIPSQKKAFIFISDEKCFHLVWKSLFARTQFISLRQSLVYKLWGAREIFSFFEIGLLKRLHAPDLKRIFWTIRHVFR